MKTRVRAKIVGRVQGVGFRPTVYRYATNLGLAGFVCNTAQGVTLEVEGEEPKVNAFFDWLLSEPPKQAVITEISKQVLAEKGYGRFEVVDSEPAGDAEAYIPPDLATCEDCVRELLDPRDRRHRYPFTNCTNCGPRFTIVRELPYDRVNTSMSVFRMCAPCDHEYHDPHDRRFHAQPNACGKCGPQLQLTFANGVVVTDRALTQAQELLRRGQTVAVKSLGGFHLACDATNEQAVARLRQRKRRPHKPFAVMFPNLDVAAQYCEVSKAEEAELLSVMRPIVILRRRPDAPEHHGLRALAHSLCPDSPTLGVFLPYTPLHHLLMQGFDALVMTSGNLTDEPIISDERELPALLGPIADAALVHDRPILHKCDDSVLQFVGNQRQFLRRARGFTPNPIRIAASGSAPHVLAVGGELKNTFCLLRDGNAFVSQHIGDLKDYKTYDYFSHEIAAWQQLLRVEPQVVAHDLHPAYLSTRFAEQFPVPLKIGVQHHHAHIASVMAEHNLHEPVIGVAFDGTGYGTDRTVWGGEFLVADRADFQREAHFRLCRMPGGDKAIEEPWRMAVSMLIAAGRSDVAHARFPPSEVQQLEKMLATGFNSPPTSSAGRLFDAVAAILRLCDTASYEAQAAIRLEAIAAPGVGGKYEFHLNARRQPWELDFRPTVRAVVEEQQRGVSIGEIAAKFHNTIVDAIVQVCRSLRSCNGIGTVALSGGVFQNVRLSRHTVEALRSEGFSVYTNVAVPPNDGGLSLGQAAVALARLTKQG